MQYEFLDVEHARTFMDLRIQLAERYRFDKEYLTICFLIAGNAELKQKMIPYFDGIFGSLDSIGMFENEDFSGGLRTLAKLAVNLFNSNEDANAIDLITDLDSNLFKLAINTIIFRRYGIPVDYQDVSE